MARHENLDLSAYGFYLKPRVNEIVKGENTAGEEKGAKNCTWGIEEKQ